MRRRRVLGLGVVSACVLLQVAAPAAARSVDRPTMPPRQYAAAKRAAARAASPAPSLAAPAQTVPVVRGPSFAGVGERLACGGCLPPDTYGVAGGQFVEVTNSHLDVYSKRSGRRKLGISLARFFRYRRTPIFDPRVAYDPNARRYVVVADTFQSSRRVQRLLVAVSRSRRATGRWYRYSLDVDSANDNSFFDFPMLGVAYKTLVVTANVFANGGGGAYLGADVLVIRKSAAYRGRGLRFHRFTNVGGATIAAPLRVGGAHAAYLVSAAPAPAVAPSTTFQLWKLGHLRRGRPRLQALPDVTVPAYSLPPPAAQPGSTAHLDTGDDRFVAPSTQIGSTLWQAHAVDDGFGHSVVRWYAIDASTGLLTEQGTIAASATSFDWNASIAADPAGDAFVTWSSTDPPGGVAPQVRFTGQEGGQPPGMDPAGAALVTSASTYHPGHCNGVCRWGDYSAVSFDPRVPARAWIVNETVARGGTRWGSRIARVGF